VPDVRRVWRRPPPVCGGAEWGGSPFDASVCGGVFPLRACPRRKRSKMIMAGLIRGAKVRSTA
jgi:hypothetical protein